MLASKCAKCGAFQDWRRFVVLGQANVALTLSLIAIVTVIFGNWATVYNSVRDLVIPTKFKIELAIIEISDSQITVLVQNIDSNPIAIEKLACFFFLPIDPSEHARRSLEARSQDAQNYTLSKKDAIGSFMIGYSPKEFLSLGSGEDTLVTFNMQDVFPPSPGLDSSPEEAKNICMLMGKETGNDIRVGGAFIQAEELMNIDLLALLRASNYSESRENERATILAEVESRRATNKSARGQ